MWASIVTYRFFEYLERLLQIGWCFAIVATVLFKPTRVAAAYLHYLTHKEASNLREFANDSLDSEVCWHLVRAICFSFTTLMLTIGFSAYAYGMFKIGALEQFATLSFTWVTAVGLAIWIIGLHEFYRKFIWEW